MAFYDTERITFRPRRHVRTLYQEGKFVLSDEMNSTILELIGQQREFIKAILGDVSVTTALQVQDVGIGTTTVTIEPGQFFYGGLQFQLDEQKTLDLGTSPGTVKQIVAAVLTEEEVDSTDDPLLKSPIVGSETAIKSRFVVNFQVFNETLPEQSLPQNSFDILTGNNPVNIGVEVGTPPLLPIIIDNSNGYFLDSAFTDRFDSGVLIDSNGNEYFINNAVFNSPSSGSTPFAGNPKVTLHIDKKTDQPDPVITSSYTIVEKDILYPGGKLFYPIAEVQRTVAIDEFTDNDITDLRILIDPQELTNLSLDNAYDALTPGGGRIITADAGAVEIQSSGTDGAILFHQLSGTSDVVQITNDGSGFDILGNASNWSVDRLGNARFKTVTVDNFQAITIIREEYLGSDGTGAGDRIFTLANEYLLGNDSLSVFYNGILLREGDDYEETNITTVTLNFDVDDPSDKITFDLGRKLGGAFGSISIFTATAGQTVFPTPFSFDAGVNDIDVFVNGVLRVNPDDYTEGTNEITFLSPRNLNDKVVIRKARDHLSTPGFHASTHGPAGADPITELDLVTLEVQDITVTGNFNVDTIDITNATTTPSINVTNTNTAGKAIVVTNSSTDTTMELIKPLNVAGDVLKIVNSSASGYDINAGNGAFLVDKDGNTIIQTTLIVNGNSTFGNAATDTVTILATLSLGTDLIPQTDDTSDLGSTTERFQNVWTHRINGLDIEEFSTPKRSIEELTANLTAGSPYTIPNSYTYFGDKPAAVGDTDHSKYMEIRVDGVVQYQGDTGFLRDYKEAADGTGQTTVTFEATINSGSIVECLIYKA